eukprot:3633004-Pleurochrysis_carterae.AAC.2
MAGIRVKARISAYTHCFHPIIQPAPELTKRDLSAETGRPVGRKRRLKPIAACEVGYTRQLGAN